MTDANVQELHHSHDEDVRLDRSITDAFCAECPSTACDLPGDQAECATLLLIGSIWTRGTDLYYALVAEHEAAGEFLPCRQCETAHDVESCEFGVRVPERVMCECWPLRAAHGNAERVMNS